MHYNYSERRARHNTGQVEGKMWVMRNTTRWDTEDDGSYSQNLPWPHQVRAECSNHRDNLRRWKTPPSWPHSWRVTVLGKWLFNKNNTLYFVMFYPPGWLGAGSQQLDRCNKCDVTGRRVRNMSCQGPGGNIRERGEHRATSPGNERLGEEREYDTSALQSPTEALLASAPTLWLTLRCSFGVMSGSA